MAHNNGQEEGTKASNVFEKVMGTLTVALIFRHFVAGAVFVMAFCYAKQHNAAFSALAENLNKYATAVGIIALLAGTLIYTLHRSITNPLIEWLRHVVINFAKREPKKGEQIVAKGFRKWLDSFFMPESVHSLMEKRWEAGEKFCPSSEHISSWGDYVHLQYTTAIAMLLGSCVAYRFRGSSGSWGASWDVIAIAFVFVASGFYTDCRKHLVELALYAKKATTNQAESSARPIAPPS